MQRIILLTGGDKKGISNYTPRSIARLGIPPASPFWLDLLSPSERLLHRTSFALRFDPQTLSACLLTPRSLGCEDFGSYLFIKASLLDPSKKSLFIQRDLKIYLSSEYLITIHKRSQPLLSLLPAVEESGFNRTGSLLLTIFNESACALTRAISSKDAGAAVLEGRDAEITKYPLWWRLRNFRAALLSHFNLLHELAFVGARFFNAYDKGAFQSVKARICFLSDIVSGWLSRVEPPANILAGEKMVQG